MKLVIVGLICSLFLMSFVAGVSSTMRADFNIIDPEAVSADIPSIGSSGSSLWIYVVIAFIVIVVLGVGYLVMKRPKRKVRGRRKRKK